MTFTDKISSSIHNSRSVLCVGLDPDPNKIPQILLEKIHDETECVRYFCQRVIEITAPYCCAYKPNLAFFESLGPKGLEIFKTVIDQIPNDKIIIADAKRGDIGHTANFYKSAYFDNFDVDAITLSPLMGFETLTPFLHDASKGVFVLTLTSNSGASDFLKRPFEGYSKMGEYIAHHLAKIEKEYPGHIGMVVGATQANELTSVIKQYPESTLLIPGIGSQGGSITELSKALANHNGMPVINSSRGILYAGNDSAQWETAVEKAAQEVNQKLEIITSRYV